jgi:O-antigen/teichoic acid export membrane protein
MTSNAGTTPRRSSPLKILQRFAHLLSAHGLDGILSAGFFLFVAWADATVYGEIMYALAGGSIALKAVEFGLYYPLVTELARAQKDRKTLLLAAASLVRVVLLILALIGLAAFALLHGLGSRLTYTLFLVTLGFGMEALAGTIFADYRVRGNQKGEARICMGGSLVGYGCGVLATAAGAGSPGIALFKVVSGLFRVAGAARGEYRESLARLLSPAAAQMALPILKAAAVFALIDLLGTLYNKTNVFFIERAAGIQGVALYSATWNIVDSVSLLASEQFLGWVVFPVLAQLWARDRDAAFRLVRSNASGLLAIAFPVMFFLHVESELIIGALYPHGYHQAALLQKTLVWTVPLSFLNNLFAYVMMVAGGSKILLLFTLTTALLNLALNQLLVPPMGILGGCLVIVFTKFLMTLQTLSYCQVRFRLLAVRDLRVPVLLALGLLGPFLLIRPWATLHLAVVVALGVYLPFLWAFRGEILGKKGRRDIL